MRRNTYFGLLAAAFAVSMSATIVGCDVLAAHYAWTHPPFAAFTQMLEFVDAGGENVIYLYTRRAQCASGNWSPLFPDVQRPPECDSYDPGLEADETAVYVLDAASMQTERLDVTQPSSQYAVKTDGRRLAWVDGDAHVVRVYDIETGEETLYLHGSSRLSAVRAVSDQYLAVSVTKAAADGEDTSQEEPADTELTVLSLGNDEAMRTFENVGSQVALDGDLLVIHVASPGTDPSINRYVGPLDIQLVNLATDDREIIATINSSWEAPNPVFLNGEQVIYSEYNTAGTIFAIKGHDLQSKQGRTIFERDNGGIERPYRTRLEDANASQMLIHHCSSDLSGHQTYELIASDGTATTIFTITDMTSRPRWFSQINTCRFVDSRVVWVDPYTGEFVFYEPSTTAETRFDPLTR
ncbi:MAG: hypothetical protein JXQ75_18405 [Phycisphaerae bacterium]|nr:hypothetical protein [Phycisphaerae bacterium]